MPHDCSFLADLDLAGDASTGDSDLETRAGDWGTPDERRVRPDAVVWPASTADVSAVLAAATERGVPVTPYAAGTGLEGSATPVRGGISLDMTGMDAILDVWPEDLQIDVEPGVVGSAVDDAVARHGLFFPPLPSSGEFSTVGGMIATDASGMRTVKYGEVADWVLELEAVLADGSVITAGSKAAKTSSGYNLKELVVGSEGTLAVVTRATLRLAGIPEQIRAGRALFPTLDDATAAVADAVTSGVDVATIELLDRTASRMANAYSGTDLPDAPTVFLEFHADHGVDEEIAFCRSILESHDGERFELANDEREMADLWQARKDLAYAVDSWDPNLRPLHPGDVTVPISRYAEIVGYAKELAAERDLLVPCFGHAGDGNVHYTVLVDPADPAHVAVGEETYAAVVRRAIELGGTATGEHGIGMGKREYLVAEHGEASVEAMRAVKRALDPTDTLNPGKVFPETIDGGRVREER
ncbi:FAD-binding oxidoreductase [Halegenticoccus tardaugens]|uniref:FAD-binding oxidoreductase n=1 Tax=Halegenticoccus tardaugens TaxID=2071624 RepID=UPI00100AB7A0|nr:FAD-linked oxidase C-terminal domain-containing protein [Halegenticoccus tardaugens]